MTLRLFYTTKSLKLTIIWYFTLLESGHGSGSQYTNEFINYFMGYKPYFLSQEENIVEKDSSEVKSEAKDLDTSFIMFALTIVLMALTLTFIYRSEKMFF